MKKSKYKQLWLLVFLPFTVLQAETIPFSSERWDIQAENYFVEEFKGEEALVLKGGIAFLKDVDFLNGIIEFDISIPEERGFMGAVWRLQDRENYEEFYLRPHQSGNPDAIQYTPVFNGLAGWQLYHGKGFGNVVNFTFNEWMHVKIVVAGDYGEVFIEDMENPVLFMHDLKQERLFGKIGVETGNFSPGRFANFSYQKIDEPELKTSPVPIEERKPGTIVPWQVSNTYSHEMIKEQLVLEEVFLDGLYWTKVNSELNGVVNLARYVDIKDGNSVLVKLTIESERDQIKAFQFGYSDIARIYFNNLIIYNGMNNYRSRDYRYLGTIGFFDEIFLPLKKGKNELLISVTENFGGWGVMGKMEDQEGIVFK